MFFNGIRNTGLWFTMVPVLLIFAACGSPSTEGEAESNQTELEFKDLKGIVFHEVRRAFKNGIAFNEIGFQQEPEWTLSFQANDSVDVYSPSLQKMVGFYLHHDRGNYYNFAREWFSVINLNKDSIVLQRLEVQSLHVKDDVRSNVYMTFYADDYIKNKLKTSVQALRVPSKKDTLYVMKMAHAANTHPLDSNHFFAARNPVKFSTKSSNAEVSKRLVDSTRVSQSKSYAYIYPEYDIRIHKAYKDFNYAFRAVADVKGNLTVHDFPTFDEDTEKSRRKLLQGILDVYVENMLSMKPGTTLGIPHASLITLYVKGTKD